MTTIQQLPPRTADWHERSRCREADPDLFFPVGDSVTARRRAEQAKELCRRCEVRRPCLAWAVEHRSSGVWGATDEDERRAMRRSWGC